MRQNNRIMPFLLGTIGAMAGIFGDRVTSRLGEEYKADIPPFVVLRGSRRSYVEHRSPGTRAHRRWKKHRAAGRHQ